MKSHPKLTAILWTLLCPGIGHIYLSKIKKGTFLIITVIILSFLFLDTPLVSHFYFMILFLFLIFPLYIYSVVDIVNTKEIKKSKWYVTLGYYLVYLIIGSIFVTYSPYRSFKMPSASMSPTIMPKDFFIADTNYYKSNKFKRGDLALFIEPLKQKTVIKRIIGIENDTIAIIGSNIYINSKLLSEPYLFKDTTFYSKTPDLPGMVIPPNQFFVLGDNRNNSIDSRHFGPIDIKSIFGKPLYVYFSLSDLKRIGIRYE